MGRKHHALAALALAALAGCGAEAELPRPRRIILVSMDTVRADHVSGFGDAATTPNLLAIARGGARFPRFYAASNYTLPSHMSILTGLDPLEHGVLFDFAALGPRARTLAEVLSAAGFATAAFHEGVYVHERFGFGRGFERYEVGPPRSVVRERLPEILDWMRAAGDEPYFLFLHTYAAHFPYGGYERYRHRHPERGLPDLEELAEFHRRYGAPGAETASEETRFLGTLYNHLVAERRQMVGFGEKRLPDDFPERPHFELDNAAMVESYDRRIATIDRAVGRLRDTLVELGQWDSTLLVVLADHGEAFFEHGLQKHSYVPFDEVLHVPLIVSFPELFAGGGGRVVDGVAWHRDVLPTVLGLAGIEPPAQPTGIDLTPFLLGREELPRDRVVFPAVLRPAQFDQEPPVRIAVRRDLKYVAGHAEFGDEEGLLFDLEADPGERENLRRTREADFRALRERARRYAERLRAIPPVHQTTGEVLTAEALVGAGGVELSADELADLEALGYAE